MLLEEALNLGGRPSWNDALDVENFVKVGDVAFIRYARMPKRERNAFETGCFLVRRIDPKTFVQHRVEPVPDGGGWTVRPVPEPLVWTDLIDRSHAFIWSIARLQDPFAHGDGRISTEGAATTTYFARGIARDGVQRVVQVDPRARVQMETILTHTGRCKCDFRVDTRGGRAV